MPKNIFTKKFPLTFNDPWEMLLFYDDDLKNGVTKLYDWQIKLQLEFAQDIPDGELLQITGVAANGSGKSQYVLAPCFAWLAISFDDSLGYITSSSAFQLDTQTERFLNTFIRKMEAKHAGDFGGNPLWKEVKRQKVFYPTGSYIDLFATDDPLKAEGKHPLRPGAEFAIGVDEGKGITEEIYTSIERCTGFTRRIDMSSAGGRQGHLYEINTIPELQYSKWEGGQLQIINRDNPSGWRSYKITAFDCPHIRKREIEKTILQHGLNDPLVRSMIFSEFVSYDEQIVLLREAIDKCIRLFIGQKDTKPRAGLDLAAGGDENVFSVWQGNKQVGQEFARISDTIVGGKLVIQWFRKWQLAIGLKEDDVNADDGGVGKGTLDFIKDQGLNFNRYLNNRRARDNKRYANLGSEAWFTVKRLIEELAILPLDDRILKDQLSNRYYRIQNPGGRIILESKQQAKANGHPSPDRADAAVLAWINEDLEKYLGLSEGKPEEPKKSKGKTIDQILDTIDHKEMIEIFGENYLTGEQVNNRAGRNLTIEELILN